MYNMILAGNTELKMFSKFLHYFPRITAIMGDTLHPQRFVFGNRKTEKWQQEKGSILPVFVLQCACCCSVLTKN